MNQVVVTRAAQAEKQRIQQLIHSIFMILLNILVRPFKKTVRIVRCRTSISIGIIP